MNKRFDSITESLKAYIPFQIANKVSAITLLNREQHKRFSDYLSMEMLKKKADKFASDHSLNTLALRFC